MGAVFWKAPNVPVPNLEDEKINPLGAYYHGNTEKNIIYLTFDSGYENGNTEKILRVLKAHNAPAIFFMTGQNIEENPELVKLILSYGQKVGNHSYHHPDMSKKSRNDFEKELDLTRRAYKKITGQDIPKFYRPPEGKFSPWKFENCTKFRLYYRFLVICLCWLGSGKTALGGNRLCKN